ncbi:related to MYND domain protein [Rhynchosporium secalis]|uniref:Related to MYND domain protein n=1 Tax=Rhynchosporium secalis TaxID=38038 RepID=A0A1E1MKT2_RHYSE|nr:related to MYND domain protein [Rhynchosporium secalis]
MDSDQEEEISYLLQKRRDITNALLESPYDLIAYIERAEVHTELGYPDLAAGDSYRALLLCDECANEGFEYHEEALEALRSRCSDGIPLALRERKTSTVDLPGGEEGISFKEEDHNKTLELTRIASIRCYRSLAICLLLCGCLKSAYDFCTKGLVVATKDEELLQAKEYIENMAKRRLKVDQVEINELPDQGLVRREIYPWNDHEPDRYSQETIDFLNGQLAETAPNVEVRVTELPTLLEFAGNNIDDSGSLPTNKQLGLFAKTDIQPGDTILNEFSLLAANNRLKESLCDACSLELPPLTPDSKVVGCPECDDIMFCDEYCLIRAQEEYHPAVCDKDIDTVAKDPDPREKPYALYLLLLSRALAMAETQEVHPLELKEVKYIWGDFLPSSANALSLKPDAPPPPVWTLPFSFEYNIAGPLHVLEKMDIDIFSTLATYDLWILNTLYSKFRGTASARVNKRNGHPEVAAVHPLWCLANHDCNPNVQWEWEGRMRLWCRENRIDGSSGGIKEGEEVLNHYCDIDLKVQERREWAQGSLGGWCMCDRCRTEAAKEVHVKTAATNGVGKEYLTNGHV